MIYDLTAFACVSTSTCLDTLSSETLRENRDLIHHTPPRDKVPKSTLICEKCRLSDTFFFTDKKYFLPKPRKILTKIFFLVN